MGWLGLLSEWVGQDGEVVGTDIDDAMLSAAETIRGRRGPRQRTAQKRRSLRHQAGARILRTWCTRGSSSPRRVVATTRWRPTYGCPAPGGTIVLEDPDWESWHFNPRAEACQKLIAPHPRGVRTLG